MEPKDQIERLAHMEAKHSDEGTKNGDEEWQGSKTTIVIGWGLGRENAITSTIPRSKTNHPLSL